MHLVESIPVLIFTLTQWIFILAVVTLPVLLNIWAWRLLRRWAVHDIDKPWKRRVAYLALASNCCVYALPWVAFIRNFILINSGHPVNADELIDGELIVKVVGALCVLSISLGAIGPKYVRFQLMFSPIIPFIFLIALPVGIL